MNTNKTLVLGLGNVIMGDEGVGVHVVRALEKHTLPAGVECLDGGTGGFILLEPLENAGRIILIDAAADGNPPGTVTRTTPRFSKDYPPTLTAHDIGVKDLLDAFYMQGGSRDVVLYAIPGSPSPWNSRPSQPGPRRKPNCAFSLNCLLESHLNERLPYPFPRFLKERVGAMPDFTRESMNQTCKSDHFDLYSFHGRYGLLLLLDARCSRGIGSLG